LDPKLSDLWSGSVNLLLYSKGKHELLVVAIIWEDLTIVVKCQSNLDLAGFP